MSTVTSGTTPTAPPVGRPGVRRHSTTTAPSGRFSDRAFSGFSHLFLLVWAVMVIYPLLWVVLSAFKDDAQIIKEPLSLIPHSLHWDNFARAWGKGHIG